MRYGRIWLVAFVFTTILAGCTPHYIELGSSYADHPPWRRGGIGDRLETGVTIGWYLRPVPVRGE